MDKKIVKNFVYSAAYQVLIILTPLVTTPYVSRVLHSDGIGVWSYTSTIATAFALFAGLGFNIYGQREIAYHQGDKEKQSAIFFEIVFIRGIITAFVILLYLGFSVWYAEYTKYLLPQVMGIIAVAVDVSWFFQGNEDFKTTVLRNSIVKFATIALTFLFVRTSDDLIIYVILNSASTLFGNLYYVPLLRKCLVRPDWSTLRPARHLKETLEFFVPLLAVQIYSYLDKIMLGYFMETTVQSGYYEQARKITSLVVGVIISLNTVMMSRISNMYANDRNDDIVHYYERAYSVIIMMALPICFGLLLVSDNFATWFFGEEFSQVAVLMKLSTLLILFMCVGNFAGVQYLGPTNQQNKMTVAYVTAACANVALNIVLIPRFAAVGAMTASIVAEFISCAMQLYFLLRSDYRFNMLSCIPRYLLAGLAMAAVIFGEHVLFRLTGPAATLVDIGAGAITYFVILYLIGDENIAGILNQRMLKRSDK